MIEDKELNRIVKVWSEISKVVSTINSEPHYKKAVSLLDSLIDSVDKNDATKESLIDTLGTLIKDYEDRKVKEPANDPIGNLKFLMEEHDLKQNDLSEIGTQGVVSEILNGKRELNLRQIIALSKKFSVSPSVFIQQ